MDRCSVAMRSAGSGDVGDLTPTCWICLSSLSAEGGELTRPCKCPTRVHAGCLARWRVCQAGREEESNCRFCHQEWPQPWQDVLSQQLNDSRVAAPELCVYFRQNQVRIKVKPGPNGLQSFAAELKQQLGLDILNVALLFKCKCPRTGEEVQLKGIQAWSAAIHAACVQAARQALGFGPSTHHN